MCMSVQLVDTGTSEATNVLKSFATTVRISSIRQRKKNEKKVIT
jgi:hypothetical protein